MFLVRMIARVCVRVRRSLGSVFSDVLHDSRHQLPHGSAVFIYNTVHSLGSPHTASEPRPLSTYILLLTPGPARSYNDLMNRNAKRANKGKRLHTGAVWRVRPTHGHGPRCTPATAHGPPMGMAMRMTARGSWRDKPTCAVGSASGAGGRRPDIYCVYT